MDPLTAALAGFAAGVVGTLVTLVAVALTAASDPTPQLGPERDRDDDPELEACRLTDEDGDRS